MLADACGRCSRLAPIFHPDAGVSLSILLLAASSSATACSSACTVPSWYRSAPMMKQAALHSCRGVSRGPCPAGLNLPGAPHRRCSSPCCSCRRGAHGAALPQSEALPVLTLNRAQGPKLSALMLTVSGCRNDRRRGDQHPGPGPNGDDRDLRVRQLTHGRLSTQNKVVHVARSALDDETQSSFHDGLQRGPSLGLRLTPLNMCLTGLTPACA